MNFLTRFFKSRPDLQDVFEQAQNKENFSKLIKPLFSEDGIFFEIDETFKVDSNNDLMNLGTAPDLGSFQLIYLAQLVSDKFALIQKNSVFVPWKFVYSIISDIEH